MSKIVIIGAGPGGYVTAIRAAQLGFDTTIIEKENLGGACLNHGCIPTKYLAKVSEKFNNLKDLDFYGIDLDDYKIKLNKVNKRKSIIIKKLKSGVEFLLNKNNVKIVKGEASFINENTLEVNGENIIFDYAIIATGAYFKNTNEYENIKSHIDALELNKIPKVISILGANTVGVEFAYIYKSLGSEVQLLDENELLEEIMDKEISQSVKDILVKLKVDVQCNVKFDKKDLKGDFIIDVRKRKGNIEALNLSNANVEVREDFVKVNENFQTSNKRIYAIGDVNGLEYWAHIASEQGCNVIDTISGKNTKYQGNTTPKCIYICPEIATVGITEEEAKLKNKDIEVSKFSLASNGMSMMLKDDKGYIKVVVGKKYKEVLGVQIVGHRATDIIAIASLAIRLEATVDEMISMVYSHPSIVEGMKEAFLGIEGLAIHV